MCGAGESGNFSNLLYYAYPLRVRLLLKGGVKDCYTVKKVQLKKKITLIVLICKPCLCFDPAKNQAPRVKGILTSVGFSGISCTICSVTSQKGVRLYRVQKCLWSSLMAALTTLLQGCDF